MRFRKIPVVIEAEQYFNDQDAPVGVCFCIQENGPHIHTLEGAMGVRDRDWVITGVKGEQYPCKPDIFNLTYEPVNLTGDGLDAAPDAPVLGGCGPDPKRGMDLK